MGKQTTNILKTDARPTHTSRQEWNTLQLNAKEWNFHLITV